MTWILYPANLRSTKIEILVACNAIIIYKNCKGVHPAYNEISYLTTSIIRDGWVYFVQYHLDKSLGVNLIRDFSVADLEPACTGIVPGLFLN